ncbi:dienelactone hydrolase family protein [Maribacter sp. HTCC2170]|uniref:dienelactone hydrolase family protein n=1 Tax=Maribacter sp. (strain HTCC2170 / KCCM 42371) TaxID=313603 RepID=UPI00006B2111|nr:dienelactone hydrolase family protein [Maribacter sp. HTCC2170]EAR00132.1 dienelactone hydrolase family protein [Maribacter sp. HTCC2170]
MVIKEKIFYKDASYNEFEGVIVWDDSNKNVRPGILISHMWSGQTDFEIEKAVELAKLGYVGFAIDNYGKGRRANGPEEAQKLMDELDGKRPIIQERMLMAVDTLKNHKAVDASRIGAIGFCFGGKCVLDLARSGTDVSGVVSFHGLLDPPPSHPEKKIKSSVLVLHGWEDPMALPDDMVKLSHELNKYQADWNIHVYGHTGHAFTNPKAKFPEKGLFFEPKSNKRSWNAMKYFFNEIFKN